MVDVDMIWWDRKVGRIRDCDVPLSLSLSLFLFFTNTVYAIVNS